MENLFEKRTISLLVLSIIIRSAFSSRIELLRASSEFDGVPGTVKRQELGREKDIGLQI